MGATQILGFGGIVMLRECIYCIAILNYFMSIMYSLIKCYS